MALVVWETGSSVGKEAGVCFSDGGRQVQGIWRVRYVAGSRQADRAAEQGGGDDGSAQPALPGNRRCDATEPARGSQGVRWRGLSWEAWPGQSGREPARQAVLRPSGLREGPQQAVASDLACLLSSSSSHRPLVHTRSEGQEEVRNVASPGPQRRLKYFSPLAWRDLQKPSQPHPLYIYSSRLLFTEAGTLWI